MEYGVEELAQKTAFWKVLGIEMLEARPGHAKLQMEVQPAFMNPGDIVHGGVASALIDSVVAVAIWPTLAPEEFPSTVDLNVHYLKPVAQGKLIAEANLIQRGRRICVGAATVTNDGQEVAFGTVTYIIVPRDAQAPAGGGNAP